MNIRQSYDAATVDVVLKLRFHNHAYLRLICDIDVQDRLQPQPYFIIWIPYTMFIFDLQMRHVYDSGYYDQYCALERNRYFTRLKQA